MRQIQDKTGQYQETTQAKGWDKKQPSSANSWFNIVSGYLPKIKVMFKQKVTW